MLEKYKTPLIIFTLCLLFYGVVFYIVYSENKKCDELVILNGGIQIEAKDVISDENGITTIELCTGEWLRTPSINIKMVKPIEK